MSNNFGWFIRKGPGSIDVLVDPATRCSGYNVVPRALDPDNRFDFDEVTAYAQANPRKELPAWEDPAEPTMQEQWARIQEELARLETAAEKRCLLYRVMRCRILGDAIPGQCDPARPFHDGMAVDEMTARYLEYVGDRDDIALACLEGKREAKSYIRTLVGG